MELVTLSEAELEKVILQQTNKFAVEKYGDTFLRIAVNVQLELLKLNNANKYSKD